MTTFAVPAFTRSTPTSTYIDSGFHHIWDTTQAQKLLNGEILLETRSHSDWGGAVTAQMYLPLKRTIAWQQLTDYPRWVQYFPALTRSEVLSHTAAQDSRNAAQQGCKRLYQVAGKAFLFFTAQVEIYLKVIETVQQQIQFRLESGNFNEFAADLSLQDYSDGTLLTYSVQATPTIPVPSILIQQAIQMDLPDNMRKMRQVLCACGR